MTRWKVGALLTVVAVLLCALPAQAGVPVRVVAETDRQFRPDTDATVWGAATVNGSGNLGDGSASGLAYSFVFGANAVLDTTGSFHVGAADYIQFFDGRFGADLSDPANTMLSSAAPSAFGFVNTPTGRVDLNGATLVVTPGESISLVGAEVRLDNSRINAPGGQITLDGTDSVSMRGNSVLDVSAKTSK